MGSDDVTYDSFRDEALRALMLSFRDEAPEAPAGSRERLIGILRDRLGWRMPLRRVVHDPRAQYAAVSLGAAVVGAIAVGLLWRRTARRATA